MVTEIESNWTEPIKRPSPRIAYPIMKIDDIGRSLQYDAESSMRGKGTHLGQRKLLMSDIRFLTESTQKYPHVSICLYVGSPSSHKMHFLSTLFPSLKFVLVNSRKFMIMVPGRKKLVPHRIVKHPEIIHMNSAYRNNSHKWGNPHINTDLTGVPLSTIKDIVEFTVKNDEYRIYVIENKFTNEMADLYASCNMPLFFMSDVRTSVCGNDIPQDIDILWNASMSYNWMSRMAPAMSFIKFRTPYMNGELKNISGAMVSDFNESERNGINFVSDYKSGLFRFPSGSLNIQPWGGRSSTELRLHVDRDDIHNIKVYSPEKIEGLLNYYNIVERTHRRHFNPNADRILRFCRCNDCAIENAIWRRYIESGTGHKSVREYINDANTITYYPLNIMHKNNIY